MNLEGLPVVVKNDIEDQSLSLLGIIKNDVIVIGGWAVRALTGRKHARYTLDIDGVTAKEKLPVIKQRLGSAGLAAKDSDWGTQFYKKYIPHVDIPDEVRKTVENIELRIEISEPRIKEFQTHHYFEFSLNDYVSREIAYHNKLGVLIVHVPLPDQMAAVKLGLPVDYKNNFDSAVLLQVSDIEKVIQAIKENDDWYEMVLRRLPKLRGRIKDTGRLENMLALNAGINVREYVRKLDYIEEQLKR
ncbi:MAG: hypothetical protein KJ655_03660 [Candidatus Thermoplasmatota archaeon]|nr:hypothetical protein [Candidatus Thermoplasmatota archaeon]